MDATKRREVRAELVKTGYAWDYVDSWPPKVDMWWHRPSRNPEGDIMSDVGVLVPNQPGHPDHAARKSRIGLLPWPPSETCQCKACRERREAVKANGKDVEFHLSGVAVNHLRQRHIHQYGKTMGSKCKMAGCEAVRKVPYKKRVK